MEVVGPGSSPPLQIKTTPLPPPPRVAQSSIATRIRMATSEERKGCASCFTYPGWCWLLYRA